MKTAAFFILIILLTIGAAWGQTDCSKTSTVVHDLRAALGPVTLSGTQQTAGIGVRLAGSATSGTASFLGANAPFSSNNVVLSWNVDMPAGTGALIEIRATNGSNVTSWYEIARIGTTPLGSTRVKSDSKGRINDDTLALSKTWPRIEYRTTLYTNTVGITPILRLMSVCYADTTTRIAYTRLAGTGTTMSLAAPWRSQYWVAGIGGIICGPTSLSMAEAYLGVNLPTETVAADAYDSDNGIYGNWPFLAQAAAKNGLTGYMMRCSDQAPVRAQIAAGHPVILGIAWSNLTELPNAPIKATDGHLVLCVGITAGGDFIINDPAGDSATWDHVVYSQDQMAHCWLNQGGVAIPISGQTMAVSFSPDGGTYTSAQDVTLTCPTANALIRYTTTGIDPTAADPGVSSGSSIHLSSAVTLKAKAYKGTWDPSGTKSAVYNIPTIFSTAGGFVKPGKWNLISLPADPKDSSPASVLNGIDIANASLQFWKNDTGGYQLYGATFGWTGPVKRGTPYWFLEPTETELKDLSYEGTTPTADFTLAIPARAEAPYWVMLGTPFPDPVLTDDIRFRSLATRGDSWLTWDEAFSAADPSLRLVDSNAQGWDPLGSRLYSVTPSSVMGSHQFDPWRGFWLLIMDPAALEIKFPKP